MTATDDENARPSTLVCCPDSRTTSCHQPKASDCSRLGLTETTSGSRTDWFLPSTTAHADGHALEDKKMRPSGSVPWRRRIDACQPEQSRLVSGV